MKGGALSPKLLGPVEPGLSGYGARLVLGEAVSGLIRREPGVHVSTVLPYMVMARGRTPARLAARPLKPLSRGAWLYPLAWACLLLR